MFELTIAILFCVIVLAVGALIIYLTHKGWVGHVEAVRDSKSTNGVAPRNRWTKEKPKAKKKSRR
jgi:hypothetical protein